MKKVGILTYHSSDNYGSVLQAYALRKYLSSFCDAQIVDYRKPEVKELYKIFKPLNSKYNIVTNLYNFLYYGKLIRRKREYESFRQNFLKLSEFEINDKKELNNFVKKYDILISGSDQVWNYDIVDFDTSFMLDFPEFSNKRISYAASFGPISKTIESSLKYSSLLEDYNYISVRENSAKSHVENLINKEVDVVCDPVFLLSKKEWEKVASKSCVEIKEEYIFCYFPGGVSKSMEKFSYDLAKKYNCKRILIMNEWKNFFRTGKKQYSYGPCDFVKLIRNAKYVCTTSFHGTAFSTIMETPFYVEIGNRTMDSRIFDLLCMTNKLDCVINQKINQNDNSTGLELNQIINYSKMILSKIIV